jgi:hypothetical protein
VNAELGDLFIWAFCEDESVKLHIVIETDSPNTGADRAMKLTWDGDLSLYRYAPEILFGKLCFDRWNSTGRDDVILWKHQAHSRSGITFLKTGS